MSNETTVNNQNSTNEFQNTNPIPIAQVVTPTILPDINLTIQNLSKIKTFEYGRSLKCFCFLDIFLLVMNSLMYWPLIFVALFPLIGYHGISNYEIFKTNFYSCFLILSTLARISYFWFFEYVSSYVLNLLGIVVNLWILKLLYKFITNIRNLQKQDLKDLREGWTPEIQRFVLI